MSAPAQPDYAAVARRCWRGLPFLWQEEQRLFEIYELSVSQAFTEEGFEWWLTRVQAGKCPVAGSGCTAPKQGRFCDHHRQVQGVIAAHGM